MKISNMGMNFFLPSTPRWCIVLYTALWLQNHGAVKSWIYYIEGVNKHYQWMSLLTIFVRHDWSLQNTMFVGPQETYATTVLRLTLVVEEHRSWIKFSRLDKSILFLYCIWLLWKKIALHIISINLCVKVSHDEAHAIIVMDSSIFEFQLAYLVFSIHICF